MNLLTAFRELRKLGIEIAEMSDDTIYGGDITTVTVGLYKNNDRVGTLTITCENRLVACTYTLD